MRIKLVDKTISCSRHKISKHASYVEMLPRFGVVYNNKRNRDGSPYLSFSLLLAWFIWHVEIYVRFECSVK